MSVPQPGLKPGDAPVVQIDFVEAGIALVVKAPDDVAIPAATGEHSVKVKLDVLRKAADFAATFSGATWSSVKVSVVRALAVERCGGHAHVLEVCRGVAMDEGKRVHAALRQVVRLTTRAG